MQDDITPLITHLSQKTALPAEQTQRLIEDVLAYYSDTVETFVARRHAELQRRGLRNSDIFEQLVDEISQRRFATTPLTTRQVRRLIYG